MSNQSREIYEESLRDWQNYTGHYLGSVPVTWQDWDRDLVWQQTFCIDEVPPLDHWVSPSTDLLLWQDQLYRSWGYNKLTTEHMMCFDIGHRFNTAEITAHFVPPGQPNTCSLLRIPVGMTIPWHSDTYAFFVKQYSVPLKDLHNVTRAAVFLEDWAEGHVVQIGRNMLSHWKAGDVWNWEHSAWHGACNFGTHSLTIMQVTYLNSGQSNSR